MAIYARLENGTYAEVTGVYKTDGTEVTEIFQGDRLVYSATNEIYGTVPLYYDGLGYGLIDYLISGNAVQDGTPSADAPVDAVGSGVRTGNLWSVPIVQGAINNKGDFQNSNTRVRGEYIPVQPETQYTISCNKGIRMIYACQNESKVGAVYDNVVQNTVVTFTTPTNCNSVCVGFMNNPSTAIITPSDIEFVMLNLGSTALPYEPYGFKLPLTVNGTEYPIFLGQVESTRRVKKQNVTISYMLQLANGNAGAVTENFPSAAAASSSCKCNIAPYGGISTIGSFYVNPRNAVFVCAPGTTLSEARALLSEAVIWYALAEPETAVVNEPLMKIGDYADTISAEQAGVTIPTVSGANVLDMTSPVKPSEVYNKGKGIKPMGYGQLVDVNGVNILDKDGRPIYVHGQ